MKNIYINRLDMCRTVSTLLNDASLQTVWQNQAPLIFTTKAQLLQKAIEDFAAVAADQEKIITGHAADKEREEAELEDLSHEIGQTLADYYYDAEQDQNAHVVEFSATAWRRLRDEQLLNRSRTLATKLSQALAADAATLANYGLDAADATALNAAIEDYANAIATPSQAIATRKALTASLRGKYNVISDLLGSMDKLVLRFRKTAPGKAFAAQWQAARVIRDRSQAAKTAPATPPDATDTTAKPA
jgi:hypothetical protein